MYEKLRQQLERDEGVRLRAYKDSLGLWTIGVGHLIDPAKGAKPPPEMLMPNGAIDTSCTITQECCDTFLLQDINRTAEKLFMLLPWAEHLDDARQCVLLNMAFNMGVMGLLKFNNTLALIEGNKFEDAAVEMLKSTWAKQVGKRAERLAEQMKTGIWQ